MTTRRNGRSGSELSIQTEAGIEQGAGESGEHLFRLGWRVSGLQKLKFQCYRRPPRAARDARGSPAAKAAATGIRAASLP